MKVIYDAVRGSVKWTAIWTWSESFRLLSGLKGAQVIYLCVINSWA